MHFYTKTAKLEASPLLSSASAPLAVHLLVFSILTLSHLSFLLFSLPSFICHTHFLSLSFFLSLVRSFYSLYFRIASPLSSMYTSPSLQTFCSIFDPSTGRALSHGSIFLFPFMDTRWVGSGKIQSKTGRFWTRETERKRYLRPANKFIPSRERCDIGVHLYRRLGKMRCQIDTAREKLPMDVSFKEPLSVRVSSIAGSLSVSSSSTVPR